MRDSFGIVGTEGDRRAFSTVASQSPVASPSSSRHLSEGAKLLLQHPGGSHPHNRDAAALLDEMSKAVLG